MVDLPKCCNSGLTFCDHCTLFAWQSRAAPFFCGDRRLVYRYIN